MAKIYFDGSLIWDKNRLPKEEEASRIIAAHAGYVNEEMASALSCGIEVRTRAGKFVVILPSDERMNYE